MSNTMMPRTKEKGRKGNLIIKTWERCKSIGRGSKKTSRIVRTLTSKSKSWPRLRHMDDDDFDDHKKCLSKRWVAPEGCFSVYVGPQKQRFVIKTEYANHPLFKILLEEAESEYGYNPEGPLALPCNVDIFCKVLEAMDYNDDLIHKGCSFSKNFSSYRLLTPFPLLQYNPEIFI